MLPPDVDMLIMILIFFFFADAVRCHADARHAFADIIDADTLLDAISDAATRFFSMLAFDAMLPFFAFSLFRHDTATLPCHCRLWPPRCFAFRVARLPCRRAPYLLR